MPKTGTKALAAHRKRLKRIGVLRIELRLRKDDVELVRGVATALSDPARAAETRALLRARFGKMTADERKAYLMAAPLDGIDLTRPKDMGRDVDI